MAHLTWYARALGAAASSPLPAPPEGGLRGDLARYRLRVDRTSPFEFFAPGLRQAMSLWSASCHLDYSGYDLSLPELGGRAGEEAFDAYLVWLDWRLYRRQNTSLAKVVDRLGSRLLALAEAFNRPIIVNNWPTQGAGDSHWAGELNAALDSWAKQSSSLVVLDLPRVLTESNLEADWFDGRNDAAAALPFGRQAIQAIGFHLGAQLLPAIFHRLQRAIIVDADDTLYRGTLGEDGPCGVQMTAGHRELQHTLLRCKQQGIVLALLSRNVEDDVRQLFESRNDFPLRWQDFAVTFVGWRAKSVGLEAILDALRFGPEHCTVLDDNPAELLKLGAFGGLSRLLADANGHVTARALSRLPGVWRPPVAAGPQSPALRTADIQANQQRAARRARAASEAAFLAELDLEVEVRSGRGEDLVRAAEISHKTNQFNIALARFNVAALRRSLDAGDAVVVVSVKDAYADSGLVGVSVISMDVATSSKARIVEWCLSCRVLGRRVEDVWLAEVCAWLSAQGVSRLAFERRAGPRNQPALAWLDDVLAQSEDGPNEVVRCDSVAAISARLSQRLQGISIRTAGDFRGEARGERGHQRPGRAGFLPDARVGRL